MIEFDYQCNQCGKVKTNGDGEQGFFVCECGGDFNYVDRAVKVKSEFQTYYCPEVKDYVTSWKDAEEKGKKFRSRDVKSGFALANADRKFINECKYIHKHREEWIQMTYAKDGIKYKPGSKVSWDQRKKNFLPKDGSSPDRGRKHFVFC